MKTKFIGTALALGLAMSPLTLLAGGVGGGNANSNWTIYGWQNWAMDFRSTEQATRTRDVIKMENEAANIGFAASIDTGMSMGGVPIKANFQCEQFTTFNRLSAFTHNGWCNRNSKLGLSGPWGEVMASGWLTPYNEVTAQSVDPFYDAGSHTHSTLLGLVGWGTVYGNSGFDGALGYGEGVGGQGFMRRKANMWQWFSPGSWGGLHVRVGWSNQHIWQTDETEVVTGLVAERYTADDVAAGVMVPGDDGIDRAVTEGEVKSYNTAEVDPSILSIGASYTTDLGNGDNLWVALAYQQHDEWAAADPLLRCEDSDDQTIRYAAKYTKDWGNGHSTRISVAYEDMEYDWEHCAAGGSGPFNSSATGGTVDFERDAWLISGKHDFPGPLDFRFMYMEADDFECSSSMEVLDAGGDVVAECGGIVDEGDSGAEAFSLGLYYTFPAGTELRLVYGEVDNDDWSQNDFGISGDGVRPGGKNESWQLGMVQWF